MKSLPYVTRILLGMDNRYTLSVNKWLQTIGAILSLFVAIIFLVRYFYAELGGEHLILGIGILLLAIYQVFFAWTAFSITSNLALRVDLDDQSLNVRNNFLRPCKHIQWSSIQSILFKPPAVVSPLNPALTTS